MSADNMVMVFRLGSVGNENYAIIGELTHPMLENAEEHPDTLMDVLAFANRTCVLCSYSKDTELYTTACFAYEHIVSSMPVEYGLRFCNWKAPELLEKLHKSAHARDADVN